MYHKFHNNHDNSDAEFSTLNTTTSHIFQQQIMLGNEADHHIFPSLTRTTSINNTDAKQKTKKKHSSTAITFSTKNNNTKKKEKDDGPLLLPIDFKPSSYCVIIGRGKKIRHTVGNQRLRVIASSFLSEYSNAKDNRRMKTELVNKVMSIIQQSVDVGGDTSNNNHNNNSNKDSCTGPAFVRHCKQQHRWYAVSAGVAREKIGYVFRDLLADHYESSSKSKTAKKRKRLQQQLQQRPIQQEPQYPPQCHRLAFVFCDTIPPTSPPPQHARHPSADHSIYTMSSSDSAESIDELLSSPLIELATVYDDNM